MADERREPTFTAPRGAINPRAGMAERKATHVTTDLLVSYPGRHFHSTKREILRILYRIDAPEAWVSQTGVWGIAFVRTGVDAREVLTRCVALWQSEPFTAFHLALKWVPVDYWCETDLEAIREVIDSEIKSRIRAHETWAMRVHRRRWQKYSTEEIIAHLTEHVTGKVNLSHPDWIIWVDVVGRQTAVSLLRPGEIFSVVQALHST